MAWMPDGTLVAAEHAFFAPANHDGPRPLVERALADRRSVLLNVAGQRDVAGAIAPAGRVIFAAPPLQAGSRPQALILLVRNQNVLPAVARLDARTAAAVYTASNAEHSRAGAAGALRATLGASPLFPLTPAAEGLRLLELLERHGTEVHVLNTWRVAGPADHAGSRKVLPAESVALVDAIAAGEIEWGGVDDLGCTVPACVELARRAPRRARSAQLVCEPGPHRGVPPARRATARAMGRCAGRRRRRAGTRGLGVLPNHVVLGPENRVGRKADVCAPASRRSVTRLQRKVAITGERLARCASAPQLCPWPCVEAEPTGQSSSIAARRSQHPARVARRRLICHLRVRLGLQITCRSRTGGGRPNLSLTHPVSGPASRNNVFGNYG